MRTLLLAGCAAGLGCAAALADPVEIVGAPAALRYAEVWLAAQEPDETAATDDGEDMETPAEPDEDAESAADEDEPAPAAEDDDAADDEAPVAGGTGDDAAANASLGPERPATLRVTGAAGAFLLLCARDPDARADFALIDREMTEGERALCAAAGVDDLGAALIGHDALILASARSAPRFDLTLAQLYLGLAAELPTAEDDCVARDNPHARWSEIDRALPRTAIAVAAPPQGAPEHAALVERALEPSARAYDCVDDLRFTDRAAYRALARTTRGGRNWFESAAGGPEIVAYLLENRGAIGVFNAGAYAEAPRGLRTARVAGVLPRREDVVSGAYALARPIYLYARLGELGPESPAEALARALICEAGAPEGVFAQAGLEAAEPEAQAARCPDGALFAPVED